MSEIAEECDEMDLRWPGELSEGNKDVSLIGPTLLPVVLS